ncbi:hypothetical protein LX36DRAFT_659969 [Colletotrichum falcatum]|nr:hypothetical protein LX36DRAFT_659969 [Colletotrichum falcatum]
MDHEWTLTCLWVFDIPRTMQESLNPPRVKRRLSSGHVFLKDGGLCARPVASLHKQSGSDRAPSLLFRLRRCRKAGRSRSTCAPSLGSGRCGGFRIGVVLCAAGRALVGERACLLHKSGGWKRALALTAYPILLKVKVVSMQSCSECLVRE